jgi:YVTN family beta-propeller protein
MPRFVRWSLLSLPLSLMAFLLFASADDQLGDAPRLRRPIAIALALDGKRLLVANRETGTVSVVDPKTRQVVREQKLGKRLSSMGFAAKTNVLAIVDAANGELAIASFEDDRIEIQRRVSVGSYPSSVAIAEDASWQSVSLSWARQIAIVDARSQVVRLDLPFVPGQQLVLPGDKVLVADAFADRLAVVDAKAKRIESVRSLAVVHNLRGLALTVDGKNVLVTDQTLHSQGHPNAGEIRAGSMLANNLQRLSLSNILDPLASLLQNDQTYPLGDIERGAGDPSAVAETPDGRILVALQGTGELAIGKPQEATWTRTEVGAGPAAIAVDVSAGVVYVANRFDDSVSIVDWKAAKTTGTISLGATLKPEQMTAEQRGEVHFFDANRSLDGWFSCHSCHTDGHSNAKLNDNLSDGSLGTPKRVLSLLGVKDTLPLAWNGKTKGIEGQVRNSIASTMQGKKPSDDVVRDLAAYLRSLKPAPGIAVARGETNATGTKRGEAVFAKLKCAGCHTPPEYTSPETYDVGLRDEAGLTHFNPPSLRGVSQAGTWLHDGRAKSLREVFERFRHRVPDDLSAADLNDLLRFLEQL